MKYCTACLDSNPMISAFTDKFEHVVPDFSTFNLIKLNICVKL